MYSGSFILPQVYLDVYNCYKLDQLTLLQPIIIKNALNISDMHC